MHSQDSDPFVSAHDLHVSSPSAGLGDLHDVCLNEEARPFKETKQPLPLGSRPECLKSPAHEFLFIALIAFAAATPVFLQRSTIVITASIGDALSMSPAEIAWATAGSGLTTGAFLLPFGHIADSCPVLPRKTLLVVSLIAFSLLAGLTSLSRNGIVLDVLTSLAGVACAANFPIAVGILSLMYPSSSRRKNMVFSTFLMGTPAAIIMGGLVSGALALKMSWKAPFVSLAALYAIVSALAWAFVPGVTNPDTASEKQSIKILADGESFPILSVSEAPARAALWSFDWLGCFLLVTGVLLFTVALTIGPQGPEPWKTPTVILLLTMGVLSLGCFVLWENVTKTPMIPPSIWDDMSVTLVVVCTLCAGMAFSSQVFWISMFMQQLQDLRPLEVAVRILPQALVGLFISPLVGLFMHRVSGTALLCIRGAALVISNILLIFQRQGSSYFSWVFPSLLLSTVGMDWILNVGSLHILYSLPLKHHSVGAALLQATSRLAVPIGMGVTTAIWSSYNGKGGYSRPELAYTKTFITTAALAGFSLALMPLIRIGKQGGVGATAATSASASASDHEKPPQPSPRPSRAPCRSEKEYRPSKRWSLGGTGSYNSSVIGEKPPTAPSIISSSARSIETPRTDRSSTRNRTMVNRDKVVWVVCEDCGTKKRRTAEHTHTHTHTAGSDPSRYFNDPSCGSITDGQPPVTRSYPGRKRFPMANRELMTHQMLTQGFNPTS